jgi:hypothetical protein
VRSAVCALPFGSSCVRGGNPGVSGQRPYEPRMSAQIRISSVASSRCGYLIGSRLSPVLQPPPMIVEEAHKETARHTAN